MGGFTIKPPPQTGFTVTPPEQGGFTVTPPSASNPISRGISAVEEFVRPFAETPEFVKEETTRRVEDISGGTEDPGRQFGFGELASLAVGPRSAGSPAPLAKLAAALGASLVGGREGRAAFRGAEQGALRGAPDATFRGAESLMTPLDAASLAIAPLRAARGAAPLARAARAGGQALRASEVSFGAAQGLVGLRDVSEGRIGEGLVRLAMGALITGDPRQLRQAIRPQFRENAFVAIKQAEEVLSQIPGVSLAKGAAARIRAALGENIRVRATEAVPGDKSFLSKAAAELSKVDPRLGEGGVAERLGILKRERQLKPGQFKVGGRPLAPPLERAAPTELGNLGFKVETRPGSPTVSLRGPKGEKVAVQVKPDRIEMITISKRGDLSLPGAPDSRSQVEALRALGRQEGKPVFFTSTNLTDDAGKFRTRMLDRGDLVYTPEGLQLTDKALPGDLIQKVQAVKAGQMTPAALAFDVASFDKLGRLKPTSKAQLKALYRSDPKVADQVVDAVNKRLLDADRAPLQSMRTDPLTAELHPEIAAARALGGGSPADPKMALPGAPVELTGPLTGSEVIDVFNAIWSHPGLDLFERPRAATSLQKLFTGELLQPAESKLLQQVFGQSESALKTMGRRLTEVAGEVAGVARSVMASFDMSMPLRQTLTVLPRQALTRPKQVGRAFIDMVKSFGSTDDAGKAYFHVTQENLANRDNRELYDEVGVFFSGEGHITRREEMFTTSLAESLPFGLGNIVRRSNRAASAWLNRTRADIADQVIAELRKAGMSMKSDREAFEAIGTMVNTGTGRGNLTFTGKKTGPPGLERISGELATAIFSPKFAASRLHLVNPLYYAKLPGPLRKRALVDLAGTATAILSVAALVKHGFGADVQMNPASTDFLKIRDKDTRIDISGGLSPVVRMFYQSATGRRMIQDGSYQDVTPANTVAGFVRNKLSPVARVAVDKFFDPRKPFEKDPLFTPTGAEGENPLARLLSDIQPLFLQDLEELGGAESSRGFKAAAATGAFFGTGTQVFDAPPPQEEQESNRLQQTLVKETSRLRKERPPTTKPKTADEKLADTSKRLLSERFRAEIFEKLRKGQRAGARRTLRQARRRGIIISRDQFRAMIAQVREEGK